MRTPYIDPPSIPEGMTIQEYRINRPKARVPAVRRIVRYLAPR